MEENLIFFKPRKTPVHENVQDVWGDIKRQVYSKLLLNGLSVQVADNFLNKFEPIFLSLIPESIELYKGFDEDALSQAEKASHAIDEYVLMVIGQTCYRELTHFLEKELYQYKQNE